jgi:hypothetical protein
MGGMGEPALWGNPPYGGTRPQRGLTERLLSYLKYHYDVLKRHWIFLKIENYNLSSGAYLSVFSKISKVF